jgi:hypothetical protein
MPLCLSLSSPDGLSPVPIPNYRRQLSEVNVTACRDGAQCDASVQWDPNWLWCWSVVRKAYDMWRQKAFVILRVAFVHLSTASIQQSKREFDVPNAQRIERSPSEQEVAGSNPAGSTIENPIDTGKPGCLDVARFRVLRTTLPFCFPDAAESAGIRRHRGRSASPFAVVIGEPWSRSDDDIPRKSFRARSR